MYSYRIKVIFKQIYLIPRLDRNKYYIFESDGPGCY